MPSFIRSFHAFHCHEIHRDLDKCRAQNPDEFDNEEARMKEKEIKIQMIGTQKMKVDKELIMCFICKEPLQDPRVTFCCENLICFKCFPENGSKKCCFEPCTKIKLAKPSGFFLKKLKTVMFKCAAKECQATVKYDDLEKHLESDCERTSCCGGCKKIFKVREHHNLVCVELLKMRIMEAQLKLQELKEKYNELETASEHSDDDLDFFNDEFDLDRMVFFNNHDAEEIWERYGFF